MNIFIKKIKPKNILLIILLIIFSFGIFLLETPNIVSADCIVCYSLFKVKIVMEDNKDLIGYIAIYTDDIPSESYLLIENNNNDISNKPNWKYIGEEDLLKIIKGQAKKYNYINIEWRPFVDEIYDFSEIGWVVVREDIKEIDLEKVKKIIFLEETNFSGAGPMNSLSKGDIEKIKTKGIHGIIVDDGEGVEITSYINLDSTMTQKDFEKFLGSKKFWELEISRSQIRAEKSSRLLFDWPLWPAPLYNNYPEEKYSGIILFLQQHINRIENKLNLINMPSDNQEVDNFLLSLKPKYIKIISLTKAVKQYLENHDTQEINSFLEQEVFDKELRKELQEIISPETFQNKNFWIKIKNFFKAITDFFGITKKYTSEPQIAVTDEEALRRVEMLLIFLQQDKSLIFDEKELSNEIDKILENIIIFSRSYD